MNVFLPADTSRSRLASTCQRTSSRLQVFEPRPGNTCFSSHPASQAKLTERCTPALKTLQVSKLDFKTKFKLSFRLGTDICGTATFLRLTFLLWTFSHQPPSNTLYFLPLPCFFVVLACHLLVLDRFGHHFQVTVHFPLSSDVD